MKAIVLFFAVALLASHALAFKTEIKSAGGLVKPPTVSVDPAWCPTCVSFMSQAINQLLNIIANAGVLGGCNDLCSLLPTQLEATVCNLVCDAVGIEAFIEIVQDADPDPIWLCEEVDVCGINDNAAANLTSVVVSPTSGRQGTNFWVYLTYSVSNTIATGEVDVLVLPPNGMPLGGGGLVVNQTPNTYSVKFGPISTTPSENEPFTPGAYQVQVAVCEGSCGSTHSHTKTLSVKTASFRITQ